MTSVSGMQQRVTIAVFVLALVGCSERVTKLMQSSSWAVMGDSVSPSIPGQVLAIPVSASQVQVAWNASSDDVGVKGYKVYRNGQLVSDQMETSFIDNNVKGTIIFYSVAAYDYAGNVSSQSPLVAVQVSGGNSGDRTPPTIPDGLAATASPGQVKLSWTACTDNVGVVGYKIFRGGNELGWSLTASYIDNSVVPVTTYSYTVAAVDASGNLSGQSSAVSVTTPAQQAPLVPQAAWTLVYVDSEEKVAEDAPAIKAFDGLQWTFWRTRWSPQSDQLPHEIQIDLGQYYQLSGFKYFSHLTPTEINGRISQYEFYVSNSKTAWGTAAATGTFTNDATEKEVIFPKKSGRYIRLRALSEVNGNPWTMVSELNVYGVVTTPPPATSLGFDVQPSSSARIGEALTRQPVIGFRDASGLSTSGTASVTLAAYSDSACSIPAAGILSAAANPVGASGGIVSFSGVRYSKGEKIYLGASAAGLAKACSTLVEVTDDAIPPIPGPFFYVAPNGSNSNDGSEASPWANLSYACGRVQTAGAGIVLKAGTYSDNAQCVLRPKVSIVGAGKAQVTIKSSYGGWYILARSEWPEEGAQSVSGFKLDGNGRTLARGMQIVGRHRFIIQDVDFVSIAEKAIEMLGLPNWSSLDRDWPVSPPPAYAVGDVIRNVTITGCSGPHNGVALNASLFINSLEDLVIDNVVVDESSATGGRGNALKSWPGWVKHMTIRNSKFIVSRANNSEPIPIEIWNFLKDCEISNSEFRGGYLSFVSGAQDGGTWALKFHDNLVDFSEAGTWGEGHELSMSHLDFYNNHVVGYGVSVWNASHMYNYEGVRNVRIRNNVIEKTPKRAVMVLPGIPLNTAIDNVEIHNNVISEARGSGIQLAFSSARLTNLKISNNVIQNTSEAAIGSYGASPDRCVSPVITNNVYFNSGGFGDLGCSNVTNSNNRALNPQFKGTGNWTEWFSLQNSSPLIDAGTNVGLPFKGSAPDIGAFELQ